MIALADGRWAEAARDNLLVALSPLVAAAAMAAWAYAQCTGRVLPRILHPAVLVVSGLLAWTMLRNLLGLDWLRPLGDG